MCLDTVNRLPSKDSLLEEVAGWAVKSVDSKSLFSHTKHQPGDSFVSPQLVGELVRKPAWGLAHICLCFAINYNVLSIPSEIRYYPSGFHIFRSKKDAESYLSGLVEVHAWSEVQKVLGRGILAEGFQNGYPVVVVLELLPRK
jgi:hypothetical protein